MLIRLRQHKFLFEELVRRDFKKKYKRTILGMGWSILSPLLMLLVMKPVFEQFFGRNTRGRAFQGERYAASCGLFWFEGG